MKRGDVVIVSGRGDYGKPRPAVVVQNDQLIGEVESITVCFLTSDISEDNLLRITVEPQSENGLRIKSQIQVEKIMTFPADKVRGPVGEMTSEEMRAVDLGLLFHLNLVQPVEVSVKR